MHTAIATPAPTRLVDRCSASSQRLIRILAGSTLVVACTFGTASPAWADLTGTTVHGSAFFSDDPSTSNPSDNLFGVGYPCEYCSDGPVATIGSGREFFWYMHDYPIDVDFTADTLIVSFMPYFTYRPTDPLGPLSFEFQNDAFVGQSLSLLAFSRFPSADKFSYSLIGDTITVRAPEYFITNPDEPYLITLGIAPAAVPEPATNVAVLGGLLMLGVASWRRFGVRAGADAARG